MQDLTGITVTINGKVFPKEKMEQWESERVKAVSDQFSKLFGTPAVTTADELTDLKMSIPDQKLRKAFSKQIQKSDRSSKLLMKLSRGKTRECVIYIDVKDASAQEIKANYFRMMFTDSEKYRRMNLMANPDHISLVGRERSHQDVVEASAAMKNQSQFFVTFGDDTGMHSVADPNCNAAAVGACKLSDGTVIGGCRHEMTDTDDGCRIRLDVEFPKATPASLIEKHQIHMAVEFSNWISAWLTDDPIEKYDAASEKISRTLRSQTLCR
jgi:hypothetical protein